MSQTNYILRMDHRLFWNVSVQDPRHNSEPYMVLGCLRSTPLRDHAKYLGGCKQVPPMNTDRPNKGGQNLQGPTEGRSKALGTVCEGRCVDIGNNVDTR